MNSMRKALLTLIAFFLCGCSAKESSIFESSSSSSVSPLTVISHESSSLESSILSETTSESIETSVQSQEESSSSSMEESSSEIADWNDYTKSTMLNFFGEILPYLNLGWPSLNEDYVTYCREDDRFFGIQYDHSSSYDVLNEAKELLCDAGWDASFHSPDGTTYSSKNYVSASNASGTGEIYIYNYYGLFLTSYTLVICHYHEASSSLPTDWSDSLKNDFSSALFGHEIPFVDLKLQEPVFLEAQWEFANQCLPYYYLISEDITEEEFTALTSNFQTSNSDWICEDHSENYSTGTSDSLFNAQKSFDDGVNLTLEFHLRTTSAFCFSYDLLELRVICMRNYDASLDCDSWPMEVIDDFTSIWSTHMFPYVSLGVDEPKEILEDENFCLFGSRWNEDVILNATESFLSSGWSVTSFSSGMVRMTGYLNYDDATLDFILLDYYGVILLIVHSEENNAFDSEGTYDPYISEWLSYVTEGHSPAFLDLNEDYLSLLTYGENALSLSGGAYRFASVIHDYRILIEDDYFCELTMDEYGYLVLSGSKTFSDGRVVSLSLSFDSFGVFVFEIQCESPFLEESTERRWK